MNKYLIFRTDRIGDFLLSLILIKSIKRNDIKSHITVVASNKNYDYIKSFKIIDEVILFKKGFFDRIKFLVVLAHWSHPYPFRTRKWNDAALTILGWQRFGKISHCQIYINNNILIYKIRFKFWPIKLKKMGKRPI